MKETHDYLVPDYFPSFSCKMGRCRTACCKDWPISLSMRDYFQLLGVNCSSELRRKLDCGMHLAKHPTQEEYAQINPRYDGDCPMRLEDGRCGVHAELGEEALPYVCRLYPRAPRSEGDYECSCANSCEAVLELMFRQHAPIAFHTLSIAFDLPKPAGRTVFFETVGREQEIRLFFIRKIQNRDLPMPERIMDLGQALLAMDAALNARDAASVDRLLRGEQQMESSCPNSAPCLEFGLQVAEGFLELLDARSDSIRRYGEASLAYFGKDAHTLEKYRLASAHFAAVLPNWQVYFEHMLVNHMFFSRFPFQDRPESLQSEFIAICGVYTLLRFLGVGWMVEKECETDFVDVAAAAFRLIDHTSFDRYAAHMLQDLGCDDPERLYSLICL